MPVFYDRIKETTTTTGTGTITLAGAATGFRTFTSVLTTGTVTYYAIIGATTEWEVGYGAFTTAGTTLARTTILASSNAGAAVNFSAGTKDVFMPIPAATVNESTVRKNINQTTHGFAIGDCLYLVSTTYTKAQADTVVKAEVVGIVSEVVDANNFVMISGGRVTGLTGLTAGTVYFLSPSSAGALTATEPSTTGQISKPLLIADTTTTGYFVNFRGSVVNVSGLSGTTTNDSAAAGYVGEYIESIIETASQVALTDDTTANVTSISLTAGDWDVAGIVHFDGAAATTLFDARGAIGTTSATLPTTASSFSWVAENTTTFGNGADTTVVMPMVRISIASTTTVYLLARGNFSGSTLAAYGAITARRRR